MALPPGARIDEDEWRELSLRLAIYFAHRLGPAASAADVEELTQECLRRVLDPRGPAWHPDRGSLRAFALRLARGMATNHRRKARRRRALARARALPGQQAPPPDRAIDAARALDLLRRRVSDDPAARVLLEAMLDSGVYSTFELAALCHLTPRAVRNARRRLGRHIDKVREQIKAD